MLKKRTYRRTSVNRLSLEDFSALVLERGLESVSVGMDIAKKEIVVVVRWGSDEFEQPWSVKNPTEISVLVRLLKVIQESGATVTIGMESTGTYGEAVRQALTKADLPVHRVSGKSVSDYQEIFDGVPSQHDGKDAAIIAELTAFQKGTPWPCQPPNSIESELRHQVHRMDAYQGQVQPWVGRLEGLLAKHWPEVLSILKISNVTLLRLLEHYLGPAQLAADPEAAQRLRSWSRGQLKPKRIDAILESARDTTGIPMSESDGAWLEEIVAEIVSCQQQIKACRESLQSLAKKNPAMQEYIGSVGAVTLCVVWVTVGDPRNYGSSGAFLKAFGLNLKERSSGKRKGELAITKRGPSLARKILFFWALRASKHAALRSWYHSYQRVGKNRVGQSEHRKIKGIVAMMRKLCRSLWFACKHDLPFAYEKVFPGVPLQKRTRKHRVKNKQEASNPSLPSTTI